VLFVDTHRERGVAANDVVVTALPEAVGGDAAYEVFPCR
jgi:hypothetical protein